LKNFKKALSGKIHLYKNKSNTEKELLLYDNAANNNDYDTFNIYGIVLEEKKVFKNINKNHIFCLLLLICELFSIFMINLLIIVSLFFILNKVCLFLNYSSFF